MIMQELEKEINVFIVIIEFNLKVQLFVLKILEKIFMLEDI